MNLLKDWLEFSYESGTIDPLGRQVKAEIPEKLSDREATTDELGRPPASRQRSTPQ